LLYIQNQQASLKHGPPTKRKKKREKIMNLEGTAIAPKACKQARYMFTELL
jgi:hypothetical protein